MNDYRRYRTHHHSRRLHGYDYVRTAAYFVTLCAHDRACLFGEVVEGTMHLNEIGRSVDEEWRRSEVLRREMVMDAFVIMPNHVHGIVLIVPPGADPQQARDPQGYRLNAGVATQRAASLRAVPTADGSGRINVRPGSLGAFVRAFKSAATRRINRLRGTPGAPVWQRNYHDRVLRNEHEWRACRRYIDANPARWSEDALCPEVYR